MDTTRRLTQLARALTGTFLALVLLTGGLAGGLTVGLAVIRPEVAAAAPGGQASRYVAISPVRVLDTRNQGSKLRTDDSLSVDPLVPAVIAAAGIDPLDVEAVAINITMTETESDGWLKVWPTGEPTPSPRSASTVNNRIAGDTIANMSIVPVGANGRISVQSHIVSHVVVDVQGVFVRATSSREGRFVPLGTPTRALDTRLTPDRVIGGTEIVVDLTRVGVPVTASAAVINVVAADTQASGFLTFWPENGARPQLTSNINYPAGNYNIAGNAITALSNGRLRIYAHGTTDVVVDVVGYMTGPEGVPASRGLFVPITPERHYDSRPNEAPIGSPKFEPRSGRAIPVAGQLKVPASGVLAVATNITMTETVRPGFLVAYPREPLPANYSTVNAVYENHNIANHAIIALDGQKFNLYSHEGSHAIVDVTGYFLDGTTTPVPVSPRRTMTDPRPVPEVVPGPVSVPPSNDNYEYLIGAAPPGPGRPTPPYSRNGRYFWGWNPCQTITYAVNAQRATPTQMAALNEAIRQVENASGFDLVYVGEARGSMAIGTSAAVDDRVVGGGTAMAVIGFSDPYETSILTGSTIGIGGVSGNAVAGTPGQPGWIVRGGFAVADITDVNSPERLVSTFSHEIAHMIGLDHVISRSELMYGYISPRTTFGLGDLNGLYNIGAAQCGVGARLSRELTESPGEQPDTVTPDAPITVDVEHWVVD